MRITKLARILIGITTLFVTGVYLDEVCVILPVKPSWRIAFEAVFLWLVGRFLK